MRQNSITGARNGCSKRAWLNKQPGNARCKPAIAGFSAGESLMQARLPDGNAE
jgi:hypothetical protein